MANFLNFNTGRQYGPEGQRIECALIDTQLSQLYDTHTVVMEDYTRGLSYVLYVSDFAEDAIMEAYDALGKETPTPEQYEAFKDIKASYVMQHVVGYACEIA